YSGTGVTGGQFDPSVGAGSYVITYSYTDGNGCSNQVTANQVVDTLPTVIFPALAALCDNDNVITLNSAIPAGGIYSGTGVTAGQFDPSVGAGSYVITYSYTDGNGCSNQVTANQVVDTLPTVIFPALAALCDNDNVITLNSAIPAGGTYSGTGVTAG